MRDCLLTKCVVAYVAIVSLSLSSLLAQEVSKSDDESFDIEPPLLVKPWEPQSAPDDSGEDAVPLDAAKLAQRLEEAKKRALRVVRLESELAKAQMISTQQQLTSLKARFLAGQVSQPDVDAATTALTQASAAAQTAETKYHKAQLDAAELNLRRQ